MFTQTATSYWRIWGNSLPSQFSISISITRHSGQSRFHDFHYYGACREDLILSKYFTFGFFSLEGRIFTGGYAGKVNHQAIFIFSFQLHSTPDRHVLERRYQKSHWLPKGLQWLFQVAESRTTTSMACFSFYSQRISSQSDIALLRLSYGERYPNAVKALQICILVFRNFLNCRRKWLHYGCFMMSNIPAKSNFSTLHPGVWEPAQLAVDMARHIQRGYTHDRQWT